ncbi:RNA polymerase, sigma-24 subunit, RpoE [Chthonomonas calidirosea]|uniref:RNA polymerase sigma factor n=1 Tax=Chthonomonas calidirosea (strain DSM 23976 / ICMP 18418 / T49) TaxID=1303518 RepID=S0EUK9_CHTCT|nr:sigma-70 family RNA polymerase sigma factor [Chthonomonas calidirosea]CCW35025.1 RNA polymerase sigma factor, sigma-70 family [Chthonomonas calidirosea T49]CEK20538.1 RNA polymerase, sigma-24 subunit, RpoE [Chthonomonas calidirosea]CEK20540.1 RNA polymerase, sigma-24 subunit, RpoE [Chthonomonas calidirosea]CEK20960.1 RNA polymerase, sigma-24 subunit, RpoE [Chthonomonas calidirosea]
METGLQRWKQSLSLTNDPTTATPEQREELYWLQRCAEGDERAVRWVLQKYRDRVVRLATQVLRSSREAEDIAQEAFVKAFRQIGQFRGEVSFYAWLYRIVVNLCLDRMRRKSSRLETSLDTEALSTLVAPSVDTDQRLAIEQIINSLSPPIRAALILREVEGLEYAEIAAVLDIPVGTVRSRLSAAREQFRQKWLSLQEEIKNV